MPAEPPAAQPVEPEMNFSVGDSVTFTHTVGRNLAGVNVLERINGTITHVGTQTGKYTVALDGHKEPATTTGSNLETNHEAADPFQSHRWFAPGGLEKVAECSEELPQHVEAAAVYEFVLYFRSTHMLRMALEQSREAINPVLRKRFEEYFDECGIKLDNPGLCELRTVCLYENDGPLARFKDALIAREVNGVKSALDKSTCLPSCNGRSLAEWIRACSAVDELAARSSVATEREPRAKKQRQEDRTGV
mmetsp:Transcript_28449/g.58309  ORF Transcript_28449/g.58309 Transcript_28449/m.58309 type:complete len:249 (-) Transcript_28449:579-1325(-)